MLKLIAAAAIVASLANPVLASPRDRAADQDRPAQAREAGADRHGCSTLPANAWMPMAEAAAKLQEQGFAIVKIKLENGCFEAQGTDDTGAAVKLHMDAATAEIVRRRDRS